MKKFFIIIMCAFLALLLPVQTLAADSVVYQMNVAFMDDISDLSKCIIIEADSLNETKRIDTQTMNRIKSLKGTNKEKALEIFNNMEIQFIEESLTQKQIIDNLNSIKTVSTSTSYLKISEDGTQTPITKEKCISDIKKLNQAEEAKRSSLIYDGSELPESTNGYMRLSIVYFYEGNGYFIVVGEFEWLREPLNRWTDAFSLYSPYMAWDNYGTNSFEKVTRYITSSGNIVSDSSKADPEIENSGAFYTWNLPGLANRDLLCQIWATLRVQDYDDYTQQLTVFSRYAHKKISLDTSFSISTDGKGVDLGVSFAVGIQVDYYRHHFSWDYYIPALQAGEV